MSKNIILTNQENKHKIKRIAYQIYETLRWGINAALQPTFYLQKKNKELENISY
jgi:hypothetical protein